MKNANGTAIVRLWASARPDSTSRDVEISVRITDKRVASSTVVWDREGKRVSAYHSAYYSGMGPRRLLSYRTTDGSIEWKVAIEPKEP